MSMNVYLLGKSREIKLNRALALAEAINAQSSWPQDAPPILYKEFDGSEPMEAAEIVLHYRDVILPEGTDATDKVRINDDTYTRGQLMDRVAAAIGNQPIVPKGTVVSGDHRTLAILLCEALDHSVKYKVPYVKAKDPEGAGLASNVRHALSAGLSDAEIIPQVNALVKSGRINNANELKALGFKHGKAQYLFNKAELVRLHGVPVADAVRIPDRESAKAKNADDPRAYVRDLLDGKAEAQPKALPGKDIEELIKLAESRGHYDKAGILKCIREGKRGPLETWIVNGDIPADFPKPEQVETPAETEAETVGV